MVSGKINECIYRILSASKQCHSFVQIDNDVFIKLKKDRNESSMIHFYFFKLYKCLCASVCTVNLSKPSSHAPLLGSYY